MASTAYPAPPQAVPYDQGAIQRGIQRGGTEEVAMKEEALKKQEEEEEQQQQDSAEHGNATSEPKSDGSIEHDGNRPRSTSNADSVVEVSLDSPAHEKQEPDFVETPDSTINGAEGDALKTPTRAMSPVEEPAPAPKPDRKGKGRATTSAATWSAIVASVVDHTDEHTTKSVILV